MTDEPKVERTLPPIHRVKEPHMEHMSTRIRWFAGLGYTVGEIQKFLGLRYQQVRNVVTTIPKRAAREDLPALVLELHELDDDLEAMDKHAMMIEMQAQRGERLKGTQAGASFARRVREDAEAQYGNPDLDDEDYGR